jgi:hypothetical protein
MHHRCRLNPVPVSCVQPTSLMISQRSSSQRTGCPLSATAALPDGYALVRLQMPSCSGSNSFRHRLGSTFELSSSGVAMRTMAARISREPGTRRDARVHHAPMSTWHSNATVLLPLKLYKGSGADGPLPAETVPFSQTQARAAPLGPSTRGPGFSRVFGHWLSPLPRRIAYAFSKPWLSVVFIFQPSAAKSGYINLLPRGAIGIRCVRSSGSEPLSRFGISAEAVSTCYLS